MMSYELLQTFNYFTPNSLVILRPTMKASFSTSLFKVLNPNCKVYSVLVSSSLVRTSLAPDHGELEDPSICSTHDSLASSLLSLGSIESSSGMVHSRMKSVSICTSTDGWGQYFILNFENSIAHFAIRPKVSSQWSIIFMGWSIRSTIV